MEDQGDQKDSQAEFIGSIYEGRSDRGKLVELDDKIRFQCNYAGSCCMHVQDVIVNAFDIWMIRHDPKLNSIWETTRKLFEGKPWEKEADVIAGNRSLFDLYIGMSSKNPLSIIYIKKLRSGGSLCPFISPFPYIPNKYIISYGEGLPKVHQTVISVNRLIEEPDEFKCFLGDSKPTVCQSYPLGRVGRVEKVGERVKLNKFFLLTDSCPNCNPKAFESGKEITIGEFVENYRLLERYEYSDMLNEFYDEDLKELGVPAITLMVGHALYNFDSFYIRIPDFQKPGTFLEHLTNMKTFFKALVKKYEGGDWELPTLKRYKEGDWPDQEYNEFERATKELYAYVVNELDAKMEFTRTETVQWFAMMEHSKEELSKVEWKILETFKQGLNELDLGKLQLTSLPREICYLHNLQKLLLFHNQLTSLPQEIGLLKNLQILDFAYNQLTNLPGEFGNLINLIDLNFAYNLFRSVPQEVFKKN